MTPPTAEEIKQARTATGGWKREKVEEWDLPIGWPVSELWEDFLLSKLSSLPIYESRPIWVVSFSGRVKPYTARYTRKESIQSFCRGPIDGALEPAKIWKWSDWERNQRKGIVSCRKYLLKEV